MAKLALKLGLIHALALKLLLLLTELTGVEASLLPELLRHLTVLHRLLNRLLHAERVGHSIEHLTCILLLQNGHLLLLELHVHHDLLLLLLLVHGCHQ